MSPCFDRSQAGAVLALWNGIDSTDLQQEYETWHTFEHVPERVGLPGFIEARRYRSLPLRVHTPASYFTCYWLDSLQALSSPAYRGVVANPTPWSARMRPHLRGFLRMPCDLNNSCGNSTGAALATMLVRPRAAGAMPAITSALKSRVTAAKMLCANSASVQPDESFPLSNVAQASGSGDVLLMLEHFELGALRENVDQITQAMLLFATPLGEPEFFELQNIVRQRDLEHPLDGRQPAKPHLLARFQQLSQETLP